MAAGCSSRRGSPPCVSCLPGFSVAPRSASALQWSWAGTRSEWEYGCMGVGRNGGMVVWVCGCMEEWWCGYMEEW